MKEHKFKLILASASPRRQALLKQLGCQFLVDSANIEESRHDNEPAIQYVQRMAEEKATCVASRHLETNAAILSADTIVTKDGAVFGKPKDQDDANRIWRCLSGATHQVVSAICLKYQEKMEVIIVNTEVEFEVIKDEQMVRYWLSGEPHDKAGAYGIQGLASAWVKLIHGSYSNVVGLPLRETNQLLRKVNLHWL